MPLMRALLGTGLVYAGSVHAEPSTGNEVVNDLYANLTHLRRFFNLSNAVSTL